MLDVPADIAIANDLTRLIERLRDLGHDALRVGRDYPAGLPDEQVLSIARSEQRVLITEDRDSGELIVSKELSHAGVISFRLRSTALALKLDRLDYALTHYAARLSEVLVVTEHSVRARSV